MSKGSGRRPTDEKNYQDNYDAIFGSKARQEPTPKKPIQQPIKETK
jgi:hypothetical protein